MRPWFIHQSSDDWEFPDKDPEELDITIPLLPVAQVVRSEVWVPYQGKTELFDLSIVPACKRQCIAPSTETVHPEPSVHRRVMKIPDSLMQSDVFMECETSLHAVKNFQRVVDGQIPFGLPIVLPSFQPPPKLCNRIPRNLAVVYLMYTLFSGQVCDTSQGKVITFPFTVYLDREAMSKGIGGYPVIAVHRTQVTNVVSMMFSAAKKIVDVDTLNNCLGFAQCMFNGDEASVIHDCAGTRVFTTRTRQKQTKRGYALFPAVWLETVRQHFFGTDGKLRSITEILAEWFPSWAHRFTEEFECVFLGCRRDIRTTSFVKSTKNMIKHPPTSSSGAGFTFGISCWRELLPIFTSAHTFFTGVTHDRPSHILGLFSKSVPNAAVYTQDEAFARGLCIVQESRQTGGEVRRRTHTLKRMYGTDFVCSFFGETKLCYKRKEDS